MANNVISVSEPNSSKAFNKTLIKVGFAGAMAISPNDDLLSNYCQDYDRDQFHQVLDNRSQSITVISARKALYLKSKIDSYTSEDNGHYQISKEAAEAAKHFVDEIDFQKFNPWISPTGQDSVQFNFMIKGEYDFEVEVFADHNELYVVASDQEVEEDNISTRVITELLLILHEG